MKRIIVGFNSKTIRKSYSTAAVNKKPIVSLDTKVTDELQNEVYKPRQHPGTDKAKVIALPSKIITSIFKSLKDFPVKAVYRDAAVLTRYLKGRHIPPEQTQFIYKRQIIADKLRSTMDVSDEEKVKKYETKVDKLLKSQIYRWETNRRF